MPIALESLWLLLIFGILGYVLILCVNISLVCIILTNSANISYPIITKFLQALFIDVLPLESTFVFEQM